MSESTLLNPGEYVADDVVGAVLSEAGVELFTGDTPTIHRTFFDLRDKFPILSKVLIFSTKHIHPFSRQLEDALGNLELARVIGMENPDYDTYIIKSAGQEFIRAHILPLFDKNDRDQISEIAKIFAQKCGKTQSR